MTATDQPATSAPPDPRETLAAELHDLAVRSACGGDIPPYDSLSEESRRPWRDKADRIAGTMYPDLMRRLRYAEVMEREARRHAAQCDLDVAEADAHAARLKAEAARVRAENARQGLEMHDLRELLEQTAAALNVALNHDPADPRPEAPAELAGCREALRVATEACERWKQ